MGIEDLYYLWPLRYEFFQVPSYIWDCQRLSWDVPDPQPLTLTLTWDIPGHLMAILDMYVRFYRALGNEFDVLN